MNPSFRRALAVVSVCSAGLAGVGCQTYQLGQVLPTPYILRDDIQYFPKGPEHPLQNELNAMQQAEEERGTFNRAPNVIRQ